MQRWDLYAHGWHSRFTTGAGGTILEGLGGGNTVFTVDSGGNGFYAGDLNVNGKLTKGGGSFKIDHPVDPENKYLSHSFVESPDMMNIYNGTARLNARGEVWVTTQTRFVDIFFERARLLAEPLRASGESGCSP